MIDPGAETDVAGGIVVRHRRPNRLITPLVFLGLAIFWVGVCVFLVLGNPERLPLVSGGVGFVLAMSSCFLAGWALNRDPVYQWNLGNDGLSTWPGPAFALTAVRHVDIGPDPHEDYVDADDAVAVCEVVVRLRPRGSVGMIASIADARRLRTWADRHGIPVRDPNGHAGTGPTVPGDD